MKAVGDQVIMESTSNNLRSTSNNFDAGLLRSLVQGAREGHFIDFKKSVPKLNTDDAQFKFARHVIAFANVARRTGKPCWIVFGADESGKLCDVRRQYPGRRKPRDWDNPKVSVQEKQVDGVEKVLIEIAENWVEPLPDIHLEFGNLDDYFVSYLVINPEYPLKPYRLKKTFRKKSPKDSEKESSDDSEDGVVYSRGTVYVRRGSSSLQVRDADNLLPAKNVPYLERKDWRRVIEPLQQEGNIFQQVYHLFQEFPLQDRVTRENALKALLASLDSGKQQIYLVGHAGQGKTVLARALAYELASRHNLENLTSQAYFGEKGTTNLVRIAEIEVRPRHPVVVFMQMRTKFENLAQFEQALVREFYPDVATKWNSIRPFFNIPGSQWVLILDALDELYNREDFVPGLNEWLKGLPSNVQVVVSARPYAVPHVERTVSLSFLSAQQSRQLLKKKLQEKDQEIVQNLQEYATDLIGWDFEKIWDKVDAWLQANIEIFDLICTPRAIDGVVYAVYQELSLLDVDQTISSAQIQSESPGQPGAKEYLSEYQTTPLTTEKHVFYSDEDIVSEGETSNSGGDEPASPTRSEFEGSIKVVGVRFPQGSKIYYFDARHIEEDISIGDIVRVQTRFEKTIGIAEEVFTDIPDNALQPLKPVLQRINPNHILDIDFAMPANATLVARVVEYLRESEEERQLSLGQETKDIVDLAKRNLEHLAWRKDWNNERFNWLDYRHILDDASRKWNEYIGFIRRTGGKGEYQFRSLYFLAFCAAEYAFERGKTTWSFLGTLSTLVRKYRHKASPKVLTLLSEFLIDNGSKLSPILRRLIP